MVRGKFQERIRSPFVLVRGVVLVVVLVLESGQTEWWSNGVMEYWSGGVVGPVIQSDLSRRDYRTQPGVLTPGTDSKTVRPEGAADRVCYAA